METVTPEALQSLVNALTHPDRVRQRQTVDQYFTDDVKLVHIAGIVHGKDNFYHVYRGAATMIVYDVSFEEVVIQGNTAVLWVTLHFKLRLCPVLRSSVPVIVFLKLRDVGGRKLVYLQYDHHSMYALFNPLGAIYTGLLQPLGGAMLVAQGLAVDLIATAWEQARRTAKDVYTELSSQLHTLLQWYTQPPRRPRQE